LAGWRLVWLCIEGRRGTWCAPSLACTAFILSEVTPANAAFCYFLARRTDQLLIFEGLIDDKSAWRYSFIVRRGCIKKAFVQKKVFEIQALTPLTVNVGFWDVMCSLVDGYERFRGTWAQKTKDGLSLEMLVPI
jgi:hypothetical protein